MSHHKVFLFPTEEQQFSSFCKALAHPARKQILDLVRHHGTLPCSAIDRAIPLHPSTIQDHLIKLRLVHLLRVNKDEQGDVVGYQINKRTIRKMRSIFRQYMGEELGDYGWEE